MTRKLVQNLFLYGTQTFELSADSIRVTINSPFMGIKQLDISLAILNPEPVTSNCQLHFHSRVRCRPLITLYLNQPDKKEFSAFVEAIRNGAQKEFDTFAGLTQSSHRFYGM